MPANPQLIVDDASGAERFRLTATQTARTDSLVEMWTAQATVDRTAWLAVNETLDEINDHVRIERADGSTLFEGRFREDERDTDGNVVVHINSYEQDAIDAEPTDALAVYNNVPDSDVFTDAINAVPTLTTGTVETGASAVSFSFAHAERSKQARDAAEPAGMNLAYRSDQSVDFLERLGTDKPGVVVSNTDQNIVNDLTVTRDSKDPVTHIRGLGAQRGTEQVTAEAVIPSYTAGDRQVWREYENTEIVQSDRLQTIIDRLAQEVDDHRRRLTVEADLVGVDVALGDRITVTIPEHDIDRLLRIVEITERIDNAPVYEVKLTNRNPSRGGDRKRRDDLSRLRSGWEGYVDRDTDAFGWQPVTASDNAIRPYPYPDDVVRELTSEVIITSVPYRAYSSGGANNAAFATVASETLQSSTASVPGDDTWTTIVSLDPTEVNSQSMEFYAYAEAGGETYAGPVDIPVRLSFDFGNQGYWPDPAGTPLPTLPTGTALNNEQKTRTYHSSLAGDYSELAQIELQAKLNRTASDSVDVTGQMYIRFNAAHTHPPNPGLTEFANETASGVDLIVNGTTVATDVASGEFSETVDIGGELTPGNNMIEASSDSLGLVNLLVNTELFRQGQP